MSQITITEALAELKTIAKRIEKKSEFVVACLARFEGARDPLEREGGAVQRVASERQAIGDLQERTISIRRAIQRANEATQITVEGESRPISDWLIWRREVAPQHKKLLERIRDGIQQARAEAKKRDSRVLGPGEGGTTNFNDIVVNVSEAELAAEIEHLETVLGTLDGQLSLKNATVVVEP
jgi:hypothetical protein